MLAKKIYIILILITISSYQKAFAAEQDLTSDDEIDTTTDLFDNEFYYLLKKNSLIFQDNELNQIESILEAISSGQKISQKDLGIKTENKQKDLKQKATTRSSISFFLNSIIYHSEEDWSIWINGNKITQNNDNKELEILYINKDYIECIWKTGYGKFVNTLKKIQTGSNLPKDVRIEITDNIANVIFKLYPNQTFVLSNGIIINEGN